VKKEEAHLLESVQNQKENQFIAGNDVEDD